MPNSPCSQRLGEILREADLVTEAQIQVALQDQQYSPLPLGEILVIRGWIQKETADFFAESWPRMVKTRDRRPLGYYLQQAYLLEEEQINLIIAEQKKLGIRFGSAAVLKGWLKQKTLDYFLEHLAPEAKTTSAFQGKQINTAPGFLTDTRLQPETSHNINSCPLNQQSRQKPTKAAASVDRPTNSSKTPHNPFATNSRTANHKSKNHKQSQNNLITNSDREDFDLAMVLGDNGKSTAEREWEEPIWVD